MHTQRRRSSCREGRAGPQEGTNRGCGAKDRGRESKKDTVRAHVGNDERVRGCRAWRPASGAQTLFYVLGGVEDGFQDGHGTIWFLCGHGHSGHSTVNGLDRAKNGKQGNQMRSCCSSLGTDGGSTD